MKRIITVFMLPVFILSLAGITSCKSGNKKEQQKLELEQLQTIESEIESNVYPLPSSAEVIKMLQDLEVGFQFGISNPVENKNKYFTSAKKAINMGVYGADLSYATLYNIQQEIINYLDAIRGLAGDLNMSQIYDQTLYDRIRQNYDYKDKLVEILTEAFDNTYAYLSDNDQQPLALLVVGGAWVEGMYLTTHVSEAAYHVAGISRNLLEQKNSFELFLEVSEPYKDDPLVSDFLEKLEPIRKVYERLGTSLTQSEIINITAAMEEVRSLIVQ